MGVFRRAGRGKRIADRLRMDRLRMDGARMSTSAFSTRAAAVLCFLALAWTPGASHAQSPGASRARSPVAAPEPPRRHLVVCVDGVPFSTIEAMRREGRFRAFGAPARMLAPFPSITNIAMTEILRPLGAGDSPGYEDAYYDAEANRMRGGLFDRFRGDRFVAGTFRELFDYHPSAIKSGLGYGAPPLSTYLEATSDVVRLGQKFRGSDDARFLGYVGGTDSLAHLGGERMLRSVLSRLDRTIARALRESGGNLDVTIFSDHGNDFRAYKRVSLEGALERAGFRVESKLRDDRSAVLPEYGLVGAVVIFTKEAGEARAAAAAARAPGVAFAAHERDGVVYVLNRRGRGLIERRVEAREDEREGAKHDGAASDGASVVRFRYRPGGSDPLGLADALELLRTRGAIDKEGFASAEDWRDATIDGPSPDAVRRVYEGAVGNVRNAARVVVSLEDGYLAGSAALDLFAAMRATHGSVAREQSLGFVMTTAGDLPRYVDAAEVWPAVARLREW
jgi:hypothetical protein